MPGPLPAELIDPHPDRLDPGRPDHQQVTAAHREAVEAGRPMYPDPVTGLWVMTAATLWERGWCCTNGCRHCPWLPR